MRFKRSEPSYGQFDALVDEVLEKLGDGWRMNYWMRRDNEWRVFCKDPGHYCYVMLEVEM